MNETQAYEVIKEELSHYTIFKGNDVDIPDRILEKIRLFIKEEEYLHRENRIKRIVSYRILSITSEWLIFWLVTGSIEISTLGLVVCLGLHTFFHYIIERIFQ